MMKSDNFVDKHRLRGVIIEEAVALGFIKISSVLLMLRELRICRYVNAQTCTVCGH